VAEGEENFEPVDYQDTWTSPMISDELTRDPEQNKTWRMGDYKFSSQPKNSWEFGFHLGHFAIDGDIPKNLFGGFGLGFHLRKSINYSFSLRTSILYGQATGLDARPTKHRNQFYPNGIGGGLVEDVFDVFDPMRGGPGEWFAAYKTSYVGADLSMIFNVGNVLFHRARNKWNMYLGLGLGLKTSKTRLDMLDSNGLPYDSVRELIGWNEDEFNTAAGKSRYRSEIKEIYDQDYETEAHAESALFELGDGNIFHLAITPVLGISRKLNKRFNISFDHVVYISDDDYLDGKKYRTSVDQSNGIDIGHYSSIRLGINLGDFTEVSEPLYWLNPLDQAFNDIANLKNQERLDLADQDNDGVIDLLDQELDTPEDCPVDTRGILLDSDGDGIADCEDKEPYSRPGCPVDRYGIADCDEKLQLDEDQILEILDQRLEEFRQSLNVNASESPDGFLSNQDGSQSFSRDNEDGSTSNITRRDDGVTESLRSYDDGAYTKILEYPDGKKEAEINDGQGSLETIIQNIDGSLASKIEYEDGSVSETSNLLDGTSETITRKADGTIIKTIKDKDGLIIRETNYPDEGFESAVLMADGTMKSQYKDKEGNVVKTERDQNGNYIQATDFTDGSRQRTFKDPEGQLRSIREFADGKKVERVEMNDGSLIEELNYPDGRLVRTTQKRNGEILREELTEDGIITSIKQRPDGSQRVIRSNETDILSNTEISAESATALKGMMNKPAFRIPDGINEPASIRIPDLSETPADRIKVANTSNGNRVHSACGDWFLPMIHFDLNRASIKAQYYSHLHNVAEVMRKGPDICVTAHGHTDTRFNNDYNTVLSYKRAKAAIDYLTERYGIDRSRLTLMYGGEESPMVLSASTEAQHFMNRRVEFRTCEENDEDMPAPPAYKRAEESAKKKPESKIGKPSGY